MGSGGSFEISKWPSALFSVFCGSFFPDGSDCGFEQAAIEHLPSFPFSFLGDTICSTVVMTYLGHLFKCLI